MTTAQPPAAAQRYREITASGICPDGNNPVRANWIVGQYAQRLAGIKPGHVVPQEERTAIVEGFVSGLDRAVIEQRAAQAHRRLSGADLVDTLSLLRCLWAVCPAGF